MSLHSARLGVIGKPPFYSGSDLGNDNAAFHTAIPRGISLGSSVTSDMWAEIGAGTFKNLFVGDYWTINNHVWTIGHPNYWLNYGDTACTDNHLLIVSDILTTAKLNNSNVTTGAIVGSDWYTGANSNTARATVRDLINAAFGSSHILSHREYLKNAVTNGYESAGAWYDSTFELMTEEMVYGTKEFGNVTNGTNLPANYTIDHGQIALFAHDRSQICNRSDWWLRGVVSGTYFAFVYANGLCNYYYASSSLGIRVAFGIKQAA